MTTTTGAGTGTTASFLETAKERWNAEVLGAVRWAQTKDWGRVRAEAEEGLAGLLGVELSREPVREEVVVELPVAETETRRRRRRRKEENGAPPPSLAPPVVKAVGEVVREKAAEGAQAVKEELKDAASKGVEGAKGMVAKGVEKAQDLVEKAKAAANLVEEKAETAVDPKPVHLSEVERALQERFDSRLREQRMQRSVEEVLRERYTPIDKRDNSRLRGL
ncbi:hypothetical protein VTK26DRAFT_7348 [Humicola hyalothermophila]